MELKSVAKIQDNLSVVYIADDHTIWEQLGFNEEQLGFIKKQVAAEAFPIVINDYHRLRIISYFKKEADVHIAHENCRIAAADATQLLNKYKTTEAVISNESSIPNAAWYFTEGVVLANYQFLKYRKDADKVSNSLKKIYLPDDSATKAEVAELQHLLDAVCTARDLINEPPVYQTAEHLAASFKEMGKKSGFKTTIFDKKKIESLKMGGLLAVNRGSQEPPTFTIMEWKPKNAVNKQPIVLVGKGRGV
jgi:leucyl aminopeptidase